VSIASQRRFLYYWALLLAHEAPKHIWDTEPSTPTQGLNQSTSTRPRVHLTQITLRMRETSKIKIGIVKAASVVIGKTSANGKKKDKYGSLNQVHASISKYDDVLVDGLEKWEVYTRDPQGNMGKRHLGPECLLLDVRREEDVTKVFEGGNWDKGKMLQSFAHYALHPVNDKRWAGLQHEFHSDVGTQARGVPRDKKKDVSAVDKKSALLLDSGREVRVKFHMGQVSSSAFFTR